MRKNLVAALVVTGALLSSVVTGCGGKTAAPAATTAAETTVAETTVAEETTAAGETSADGETTAADEATEAEETTAQAASGDYLSWSGKEWKAASDEDKQAATKLYLIETIKATAKATGQEYSSEMEAAVTDDVVKQNVAALDTAFMADETITLQDMLELTTQAATGMIESAANQAQ